MGTTIDRLRWRCRRGTRELDHLLGWYLEARFAQTDVATQSAFSTMLEQQDPDLWNWLSGNATPDDARWQQIVDEIRSHHCV